MKFAVTRALPLLGLLSLASLPALAETPADTPAVQLLCGGIGSDESSAMLAETKQHALTITFVSSDGHYMSDVQTRVENLKGDQSAEQSCGPIGQVDVSSKGRYKVKASFGDQRQEKTLSLKPTGGQRLVLRWKAD